MKKKEYLGQKLGLRCPKCSSNKLTGDGYKVFEHKMVRRYLCHGCLCYTVHPRKKGKKQ